MSRNVIGFMLAFAWFALCNFAAAQTGTATVPCDPATTSGSSRSAGCGNSDNDSQEPKPAETGAIDARPQEDPTGGKQAVLHYTPALNGGDPIVVPQPYRMKFLFGSDVTGGYDSAVAGSSGDVPASVFLYNGYVAGSLQGRQSYMLLQQSTSFTHYGDSGIQNQMFNRTALSASGAFSRRWSWTLDGLNSIGNDAMQTVGALPSRMVGRFSTGEPVSAAYGIDNGRIWDGAVASSLTWTPDDRQTVRVSLADGYNRRFSDDSDGNIANARFDYIRKRSERVSYGFYGQSTHERSSGICNSNGGGFRVATRPTSETLAELAVGPEFDSSGCGRRQALNAHLAFAGALNASTRFYIAANREFSSGYVRNSTWEDNIVIGIGRKLGRATFFSADAGYAKGALLSSLSNYHGYFLTTEVRRRISEDFALLAAYRRFDNTVTSQGTRRNVVLFTLVWSPSRHDARRSDPYTKSETATGSTP